MCQYGCNNKLHGLFVHIGVWLHASVDSPKLSASTSIPESNTDHAQPIVRHLKEESQESLRAVLQPPRIYNVGAMHQDFLT